MAMINMKSKPEREEMPGDIEKDEPSYPYGLCISLEKDSLDKLGISTLPKVGTEMTISAKAYVKTVSSYQTQGGDDMRVELQITDMEVMGSQVQNAAATMLYGATESD
jgi:hypothetical protein